MNITDIDVFVYVIAFAVLGAMTLGLGLFFRGRVDDLVVDPKLADRLSDDEHEYRASQLHTGVVTMLVAGTMLLLAALGLYIWFM